jgi:hypothetical protein
MSASHQRGPRIKVNESQSTCLRILEVKGPVPARELTSLLNRCWVKMNLKRLNAQYMPRLMDRGLVERIIDVPEMVYQLTPLGREQLTPDTERLRDRILEPQPEPKRRSRAWKTGIRVTEFRPW